MMFLPMRNYFTLLICLALGLGFSSPAYALEAPLSAEVSSEARQPLEKSVKARKKGGLFKSFQAVKALKKGVLNGKIWAKESASNLGKVTLFLFISGIILVALSSVISVAVGYLGLLALVVSGILSISILLTEKNKKSRTIAWIVLLTTLIPLCLVFFFFAALAS